MKVQVFKGSHGGATLMIEGQNSYIPFGLSPETILNNQDAVKARLARFESSTNDTFAPVGEPVGTIEV